VKRVRSISQAAIVAAACFVKIFPLSGILFGLLAVILLSRFSGPNNFADWFRRPTSWSRVLTISVLAAIGSMTMTYLVITIFRACSFGGPDFSRFQIIKGNGKLLAIGFITIWSVVAFGEEIIGRGFLIDRLSLAFEGIYHAPVIAVIVSSLIFGSVHFYQGVAGVVDNTITGLIFGAVYLKQDRNLWANVFSHGLIDSIFLFAFYFGATP
jgi:hypothetical protein